MSRSIMVLGLLGLLGCASASAPSAFSDAQTVGFSALVDDPEKYDQAIVRVAGTYTSGFEASILRETERGPQIWVEFDSTFSAHSDPKVLRVFGSNLHHSKGDEFLNRSVKVVFVGWFDGVKPTVQIPGRTLTHGFGHMSAYDFRLRVLAVEEARWSPW